MRLADPFRRALANAARSAARSRSSGLEPADELRSRPGAENARSPREHRQPLDRDIPPQRKDFGLFATAADLELDHAGLLAGCVAQLAEQRFGALSILRGEGIGRFTLAR